MGNENMWKSKACLKVKKSIYAGNYWNNQPRLNALRHRIAALYILRSGLNLAEIEELKIKTHAYAPTIS